MRTVCIRTKIVAGILALMAWAAAVPAPATPGRAAAPVDYLNAPVTETQLLDWGHRPDWSPDGTRIAFLGLNHHFGAGYAHELDLATGDVRCLTCHLEHGEFLRIYHLADGSYLLQRPVTQLPGPVDTSIPEHFGCAVAGRDHQLGLGTEGVAEPFACELYWLDPSLEADPQPLGVYSFEEVAISRDAVRIAWVVPATPVLPQWQIWTGELVHDGTRMQLTGRKKVFETLPPEPSSAMAWVEVMDFFPGTDDQELLFYANFLGDDDEGGRYTGLGEVFSLDVTTGAITNHSKSPGSHDEAHLFYPRGEFALNERDGGLWALKLDGTGRHQRRFVEQGIAAVSSPDGTQVAYNKETEGPGGLWVAAFAVDREPAAAPAPPQEPPEAEATPPPAPTEPAGARLPATGGPIGLPLGVALLLLAALAGPSRITEPCRPCRQHAR